MADRSHLKLGIKRKHTRFQPEGGGLARIDSRVANEEFCPEFHGLVVTEAYGGCGLIVCENVPIQPGQSIRIQVGNLSPLVGQVRWRKTLDESTVKLGIQYQE